MRRILIITVAAALSGCIKTHPRLDPSKPVEYVVTVRADQAWQDNHIMVKAGQVIQCEAEGQWSDHFSSYGPEGNPDIYKKHFSVNAPANSLIMQIGAQTNISYFIGQHTNIVAERYGEIRFRKNYSLPIKMEGEIKVKVKVCSDTDADGISDYDEIHVYKTNPLSTDSDGDGFSDLEEIANVRKPEGTVTNAVRQDSPQDVAPPIRAKDGSAEN